MKSTASIIAFLDITMEKYVLEKITTDVILIDASSLRVFGH